MGVVLAQINIAPGGQFSNLGNVTLASIVSALVILVLIVASLVLFFVLIIGGIAVITSGGGDSQQAARGRTAVTGALIGLLVVFGAWAIINLINIFFDINILSLNIQSAVNQ
jgi:hypothetical protein